MTRVKPGERKRARAPKVRSGCKTCRVRRVKCDETRPSCLKCSSTGRTCDGYVHEPFTDVARVQDWVEVGIPSGPAVSISRCSKELRSFQHFTERTRLELQGAFACELWSESLLRLAYFEPAIRHAVVALSSFHELFHQQRQTSDQVRPVSHDTSFALTQYNLAIKAITSPRPDLDRPSATVALVSCIVFFSIEVAVPDNHDLMRR